MLPWPLSELFAKKKPRSRLAQQIAALKAAIAREDEELAKIEQQFWRDGGVCCPDCGEPGYSDRERAQERRETWLALLVNKQAQRDTWTDAEAEKARLRERDRLSKRYTGHSRDWRRK